MTEGMQHDRLQQAAKAAGVLPALLLQAQKVAQTFMRGAHGRRRTGPGETFWQFRAYEQGDMPRDIDWRQSAKRDDVFIRQREWEAAQTVWMHRDASASMLFRSRKNLLTKQEYAEVLLLALSMILLDGGEQVGLLGTGLAPQNHAGAVERILAQLPMQKERDAMAKPVGSHARVALISDFFSPTADLSAYCADLARRHVGGILIQVNDPAEEDLSFDGRVRFTDSEDAQAEALVIEDVAGVRAEYKVRFLAHRATLEAAARAAGWAFVHARTNEDPTAVLTRIYDVLSMGQG